jgi:hypothetical protein
MTKWQGVGAGGSGVGCKRTTPQWNWLILLGFWKFRVGIKL